jgi:hypothetical protein
MAYSHNQNLHKSVIAVNNWISYRNHNNDKVGLGLYWLYENNDWKMSGMYQRKYSVLKKWSLGINYYD